MKYEKITEIYSDEEKDQFDKKCIVINLKTKYISSHKVSDELERVLIQIEREVLALLWDYEIPDRIEEYSTGSIRKRTSHCS